MWQWELPRRYRGVGLWGLLEGACWDPWAMSPCAFFASLIWYFGFIMQFWTQAIVPLLISSLAQSPYLHLDRKNSIHILPAPWSLSCMQPQPVWSIVLLFGIFIIPGSGQSRNSNGLGTRSGSNPAQTNSVWGSTLTIGIYQMTEWWNGWVALGKKLFWTSISLSVE